MLLFLLLSVLLPLAEGVFTVSNTLGSNMVLQRNVAAVVWGQVDAGKTVQTTFNGKTYIAQPDASGIWRQPLPPTKEGGPYTIQFLCSDGNQVTFTNV